jgi:PLP dependent protein
LQAAELGKKPACCLQVKLTADPTKAGFERDQLKAALPALDQLTHLAIVGLMVIAPYGLPSEQIQALFADAESLRAEIAQMKFQRLRMDELSMGMSGDFEWAIAAGATAVRIGSGLFGARD